MRHAVPKSTETRADKRAGRIFIDLAGPFHVESLAGSRFAMLCVGDLSRYKIVAFMAKKSDATAVLRAIIARYFAPAGLQIGVIWTDNGGKFQGAFQSLLAELGIKREPIPPYTHQYNGVAERTLGLLRDKTVALLHAVTEGASECLWAEAMAYACDMSTSASPIRSITTGHRTRCGMVGHPRSTPCYRSVSRATGAWKSRRTSWLRAGPSAFF